MLASSGAVLKDTPLRNERHPTQKASIQPAHRRAEEALLCAGHKSSGYRSRNGFARSNTKHTLLAINMLANLAYNLLAINIIFLATSSAAAQLGSFVSQPNDTNVAALQDVAQTTAQDHRTMLLEMART